MNLGPTQKAILRLLAGGVTEVQELSDRLGLSVGNMRAKLRLLQSYGCVEADGPERAAVRYRFVSDVPAPRPRTPPGGDGTPG